MSNITEDELTEAINILCDFAKDHQHNNVGSNATRVKEAVKYIDKAMKDDDLVMVYYP